MGYFSEIMGKLSLAGFEAIDNSLRKRSIRKALENGNYSYAASLCKESGQIEKAADICFENRDFGRAMDYYAKANLSNKIMKAATEGYKAVIENQPYEGNFFTDEKKLNILKEYSVLSQFLEQISPILNGQNLYNIASDLEKIGEEKQAAEQFLRLAREGEKKWYHIYDRVFKYYIKTGQTAKARDIALEWFKTGHEQCGTWQMSKLREMGELEAFAEEAVKARRFYFFDQLGDLIDFGFGSESSGKEHNIKDFEDVIDLFVKHYKEKPTAYNLDYVAEWYERTGKPEKAVELLHYFNRKDNSSKN